MHIIPEPARVVTLFFLAIQGAAAAQSPADPAYVSGRASRCQMTAAEGSEIPFQRSDTGVVIE